MHTASALREHPHRRVRILRRILNFAFDVGTRRDVHGLEKLPPTGGYILVFNHLSNFDPHLIFTLVNRTDAIGLVAAGYRNNPFYRLIIESTGGVWLRRGEGDRAALRTALALLEAGWMVGIAPEGGRSPMHALREGKPGPAFLATRTQVPVVPVALTNTEKLSRDLPRLRRTTVTIRIGTPFMLPPLAEANHKQQLRAATDTIMCRIAALLPPEYRGVYAGHPELKELLAGGME